jgi:uncharacterized protein involved in exopolysaccharide biosynthesis
MPEQDNRVVSAPGPGPAAAEGGYAIRLYPLDESEEIRLAELWHTVWAGKWLIVLASVLLAATAVAASFLITPDFRAQVVLSPVGSNSAGGLATLAGQFGGLASLAGINLGAEDNVAESIAILKSRALTARFIRERNLLPVIFYDDWDAQRGTWSTDDPKEVPTIARGVERFDKSIRNVNQDVETGLVTLTVDWRDPVLARDWAQALVAEVNADMRGRAIEQSKRNIEFLKEQIGSTDEVELRTAVFGVMESEMKNAMLAAVRTDFAFDVIDPAVVPERPFWPNRILFAAVGFFLGGLVGVATVLLRRGAARNA